jgi:hypothetical protein
MEKLSKDECDSLWIGSVHEAGHVHAAQLLDISVRSAHAKPDGGGRTNRLCSRDERCPDKKTCEFPAEDLGLMAAAGTSAEVLFFNADPFRMNTEDEAVLGMQCRRLGTVVGLREDFIKKGEELVAEEGAAVYGIALALIEGAQTDVDGETLRKAAQDGIARGIGESPCG